MQKREKGTCTQGEERLKLKTEEEKQLLERIHGSKHERTERVNEAGHCWNGSAAKARKKTGKKKEKTIGTGYSASGS